MPSSLHCALPATHAPTPSVPLGPVSGGLLLRHFSWGSVFLVNVPVVLLAMALVAWMVPTSRDTTVHPDPSWC